MVALLLEHHADVNLRVKYKGKSMTAHDMEVSSGLVNVALLIEDRRQRRRLALVVAQGDAQAQLCLGSYCTGEAVPQDGAEGMRWWLGAAEEGHAEAQGNLGVAYWNGVIRCATRRCRRDAEREEREERVETEEKEER